MHGVITKSTGSWYEVRAEDGTRYSCRLRGLFKLEKINATNPVTVGDKVEFEKDQLHSGEGRIVKIMPRDNYIVRRSPHRTQVGHLIAANLDQACLIVSLKLPRTSLGFIDRFLVTAETFRIPVSIVFNKKDLLEDREIRYLKDLADIYNQLGYQCFETSALTGEGLEKVRGALANKTSLFSGVSGAGKSSILNKLSSDISQKVAPISSVQKGKHTTTFAQMFELSGGAFVIDTPGIKELGLLEVGDEELSHYFPEMRDLFGQCKYHNCSHTHEPGCAIPQAITEGKVAVSRYESYLSILQGEDNRR